MVVESPTPETKTSEQFKTTPNWNEIKNLYVFRYNSAILQHEKASADLMLFEVTGEVISYFSKVSNLYLFLRNKIKELPPDEAKKYVALNEIYPFAKNPSLIKNVISKLEWRRKYFDKFTNALDLMGSLLLYLGYTAVERNKSEDTPYNVTWKYLFSRYNV